MGFNSTIEVLTSKEFKISGCIGSVTSLAKKTNHVADKELGIGGTNSW